jgi:hypothetical protein
MSVKWWATTVVEMQFGTGATPGPYYSHWQQDNRVPTNQTTSGTVSTGSQLASPLTAGCVCYRVAFNTTPLNNNARLGGMGLFGTTRALIVAIDATTPGKARLCTLNGSTLTTLATESGASVTASSRIDLQVTSWGATANVKVYVDFNLVINFTGDITQGSTMNNFDCYALPYNGLGNNIGTIEMIISDDDSRNYAGVVELTPTTVPGSNAWTNTNAANQTTGTYSTPLSDANPASSNTNAQNCQYTPTNIGPTTGYTVVGRKLMMRAAQSVSASVVSQIAMGYYVSGTAYFGTGAAKSPPADALFRNYEQYDFVNPATSNPWALSELNSIINLQAQT